MADEHVEPAADMPDAPDTNDGERAALAALTRERDELKDRLLRQAAEFDNYRKRVDRERRASADESVLRVLLEVLNVVDDFELALNADTDNAASYKKGIDLIYGKLLDVLRKQNVKPIEALGAQFDPNLHEAVMHEPSDTARDGEVIGELRRGYTQGERLLRAAMVKVAQA